ncbi:putative transcription regulator Others family [Medicago truncatula]|uniref:Paired amphipathic helix protein n=1 Tax=Medicago truncatula TaxID=3880 RepID=A0A072VR77_MEDTR|nr:paired amphipathic helix protein [Medicago truncatula]RHN82368.1 putative transcription regulator Others family [Medicago truncatula]
MKITLNNDESSRVCGDVSGYFEEVKAAFQYNKKYFQFIKLIKDFRARRIDSIAVKARVKRLFKGNSNLMLGFNSFLPKEHRIQTFISLRFKDASPLLKAIKVAFQDKRESYYEFSKVLQGFKDKRIDSKDTAARVKKLLKGQI